MVKVAVDGHQDGGCDSRGKSGRKEHAKADRPPRTGFDDLGTGGFLLRDMPHGRTIEAEGLGHFADFLPRGVGCGARVSAEFHFAPPIRSRIMASARYKCDFTVLRFIPMVPAISSSSISSTKRSTKTVRCCADKLPTARQTAATRSRATVRLSGELRPSGTQSLMSMTSSEEPRVFCQKRRLRLRR